MAGEGKKSKTDVAARQAAKAAGQTCKYCGNKLEVVMTLTASGRKHMIRKCCGTTA